MSRSTVRTRTRFSHATRSSPASFLHVHPSNDVPSLNHLGDLFAYDDVTEDGVLAVEVVTACQRHVDLAVAKGRVARMGHAHGALRVHEFLRQFRRTDWRSA